MVLYCLYECCFFSFNNILNEKEKIRRREKRMPTQRGWLQFVVCIKQMLASHPSHHSWSIFRVNFSCFVVVLFSVISFDFVSKLYRLYINIYIDVCIKIEIFLCWLVPRKDSTSFRHKTYFCTLQWITAIIKMFEIYR